MQSVLTRAQDEIRRQLQASQAGQNQVGQSARQGFTDPRAVTGSAPTFDPTDAAAASASSPSPVPGAPLNEASAPLTGFASRFAPGYADLLQNEPAALLAASLQGMGLSPDGGIYGTLEPLAELLSPLFMLFQGDQVRSQSDILNYGNDFFQNQATAGGQGVDYGLGMQNLFNTASNSPLGQFLGGGQDAQQQVRNFGSLYNSLLQSSVPLVMQGAQSNYLNQIARDYILALAEGRLGRGDFADYVGARQPFQQYQ